MNVLLVDDDPDFVALTKRWLEREGHAVSVAVTGPAALEMLSADPLPGVLVLDVQLPSIDGFSILKRVRADERLRDLPVVIVSSLDRAQDVARGLELGADDYIVKPLVQYHFLGRIARFAKPQKT
jgi:DNA-binding response OmpR family regulator